MYGCPSFCVPGRSSGADHVDLSEGRTFEEPVDELLQMEEA